MLNGVVGNHENVTLSGLRLHGQASQALIPIYSANYVCINKQVRSQYYDTRMDVLQGIARPMGLTSYSGYQMT